MAGPAGHDDPAFAAIVAAHDGTGGSVRPRCLAGGLHRSAQPGFVAGDDQALDFAGALVDLGDLGVAEVALDRPFLRITHAGVDLPRLVGDPHRRLRSEEHTSELQSLMRISYAVFCLKKKNDT